MDKPKVYIDGKEGTTGLQIYDRLAIRQDIELLLIDDAKRKDSAERRKLINAADLVFLCLPDAAAVEAVSLIENKRTRVIDCSTAHRTNPEWDYGFPELSPSHRESIHLSWRVANPGCHATGFVSIVYPLTCSGVLPKNTPLTCFSLTGYSGGGKKMIGRYEDKTQKPLVSPALYGLLQNHKHLPEMQAHTGLTVPPVFVPVVDDYYKGMATTVMLHRSQLKCVSGLHDVWDVLAKHYGSCEAETEGVSAVRVEMDPTDPESGVDSGFKIYADQCRGQDSLSLLVAGNDEQFTITALFDNLGKGASGAAVQNMNLMLGFNEAAGLNL